MPNRAPKSTENDGDNNTHVLKIPYINEVFTRMVRKALKNADLNSVRVVTTAGMSVKSLIKVPKPQSCNETNCELCAAGFYCQQKHNVYKLTCQHCPGNSQFYEGGSRRRGHKRLKEHEASVRRFNPRTAAGQHMQKCHPELKPEEIKNKVNFSDFLTHFKPEIIDRGVDTLDTFVREGVRLKNDKPPLNNMCLNGFNFV